MRSSLPGSPRWIPSRCGRTAWGYLREGQLQGRVAGQEGRRPFRTRPAALPGDAEPGEGEGRPGEAQLAFDEAEYQRNLRLARPSRRCRRSDLEKSAAARGVDIANVAADKAVVASRQLDLEYTKVTAPVSGRVSRYIVTVGNLIQSADQANVTLLTTIVSVDPMYAYFDVDERTVQRVRQLIRKGKAESARRSSPAGRVDRLRHWPATEEGFPHQGTINFVDNQVNPKTGTLRVRGVFPNKDETLSAGFFARVRVPIGPPHQALLVSDRAWTPTRARRSCTSSTTRTRSSPAPFGWDRCTTDCGRSRTA